MCKFRRTRLLRLKSSVPIQPITLTIASLLGRTDLSISTGAVIQLANTIKENLSTGYRQLETIDEKIGGVGLHNVNKREGDTLTGAYKVQFRPLFRPIQYVYKWLSYDDPVWNARRIVQDSCLHLENAVKFRFSIPEGDRASLGVLLSRRPVVQGIEPALLDLLCMLNRIVYGASKHSVEDIDIDAHRFTPADALNVYLICRWAGVKLLEPTGLFNYWKKPD